MNNFFMGCRLALALMAACASASAQNAAPKSTISSEGAERLAAVCEAWAEERNLAPAIWVLDAFGDPVYMSRKNGTSKVGVDTARLKAETALYWQRPTGAIREFITDLPTLAMMPELNTYPVPGGFPIVSDGQVIGAIGVGGIPPVNGVSQDVLCAQAALDEAFPESR